MCGIAGLIDFARSANDSELRAAARTMAAAIAHRGPDGADVWADEASGIAFGHRRLAIVELSPAGAQPMRSRNGRFVICYNGEIYNAAELRGELVARGHVFRGLADTEVIVEGCVAWGVRGCIERLNGMFAIALWDRERRELKLVRDRVGIKPLYWSRSTSLLLFGSELKALRAHPRWRGEINRNAIAGFMRHGYIAGAETIHANVERLQPGRILTIDANSDAKEEIYWDIRAIAARAPRDARDVNGDVDARAEALLKDAVRRCMVSDVPLGAFLSGGVDSSAVVALMQSQSSRPVRTFTIGFNDAACNEAEHAKAVAKHLGTEHTELHVSDTHLMAAVGEIGACYDEPFADPSAIPTYLLAALTRREVTVALSGDGGDELFGGYTKYWVTERQWRRSTLAPRIVQQWLAPAAEGAVQLLQSSAGGARAQTVARLQKLANHLATGGSVSMYRELISHWPRPDELVLDAHEPSGGAWEDPVVHALPSLLDQMRLLDFLTYLPEYCLTKVDRATMAVSLEARVPLLDHRVVEFAWSLPSRTFGRGDASKSPLRKTLYRHVPRALIERPKRGFVPPLGAWLRGPLRDWAEALLDEKRLAAQGLLNVATVRKCWRDHLDDDGAGEDRCWPLWNVICLQTWLDHQSAAPTPQARPRVVEIEAQG